MNDVLAVILRVAGATALDLGVKLAEAIFAGDTSAVEELTKTCPEPDQIAASAAALKVKKRLEADAYFAALAAPPPSPPEALTGPGEQATLTAFSALDPAARLRVLRHVVAG